MAGRERWRLLVCEVTSNQPLGMECTGESVISAFRNAVISNYGEFGEGTVGSGSRVVASFVNTCGIFILKVPSRFLAEAVVCVSLMAGLNGKPITARVVSVCGRMKNAVAHCTERVLLWRNTLPPGVSAARKPQLDEAVRSVLMSLNSLPSYF